MWNCCCRRSMPLFQIYFTPSLSPFPPFLFNRRQSEGVSRPFHQYLKLIQVFSSNDEIHLPAIPQPENHLERLKMLSLPPPYSLPLFCPFVWMATNEVSKLPKNPSFSSPTFPFWKWTIDKTTLCRASRFSPPLGTSAKDGRQWLSRRDELMGSSGLDNYCLPSIESSRRSPEFHKSIIQSRIEKLRMRAG